MSVRLRMQGISKRFGATVALREVSFEAPAGTVVALVGENGAGKSTLMKVLSGAVRPDAGTMELDGQPYRPRHPLDGRRAGVAMIYQELALAPHLSVLDNIWLGNEPPYRERRRHAAAALAELGHAELSLDARVGELSVAEQQMVELARAVATDCRVLVLDEPTSTLTRPDVERLFGLIRRLKAGGRAVVYISHFLEEVTEIADRVVVLRDGEVVGERPTAEWTIPALVAAMVGREVRELYPRSARTPGEVVWEVDGLAVRRGEVVGIAGLIGAGRTELLRRMFAQRNWRARVGMVSEDRGREGLAVRWTAADNVTLPRLPWWVWPRQQAARAGRWLAELSVKCRSPWQRVSELSGGNQQKLAVARLLDAEVEVWLLDEPTRGIDVASKAEIYRRLDDAARAGKAVVMVSSYLPELLGVCDRVAVMCRGRLGAARPVGERNEHEIMLEATGVGGAP